MSRVIGEFSIEDVILVLIIAGLYGLEIFANLGQFLVVADCLILIASLVGYGAHRPIRPRPIGPAHFYAISSLTGIALVAVYVVAVIQAKLS